MSYSRRSKQTGIRYSVTDMGADRSASAVQADPLPWPSHGYNTLATGLVYIKNDQQAILSWHKYLSNYFEQFILLSTNKNMYCPASQE